MAVHARTHSSVARFESLLIMAYSPAGAPAGVYETFMMVLDPKTQVHSFYLPSLEIYNIRHGEAIILLGYVLPS